MCLNFSAIFSDSRVIIFTKPSQIGQLSPFFAKNPKKSEQNGKFPASALQNGKKSAIIIMYEIFCKKRTLSGISMEAVIVSDVDE